MKHLKLDYQYDNGKIHKVNLIFMQKVNEFYISFIHSLQDCIIQSNLLS